LGFNGLQRERSGWGWMLIIKLRDMWNDKHDYIKVDNDGTVECTKCGLRNSSPEKEDMTWCNSNSLNQ